MLVHALGRRKGTGDFDRGVLLLALFTPHSLLVPLQDIESCLTKLGLSSLTPDRALTMPLLCLSY